MNTEQSEHSLSLQIPFSRKWLDAANRCKPSPRFSVALTDTLVPVFGQVIKKAETATAVMKVVRSSYRSFMLKVSRMI